MAQIVSLPERERTRKALARLQGYIHKTEDCLRRGTALPADTATHIEKLTGTLELSDTHRALEDLHQQLTTEYMGKLLDAAPDDFSAFCEYMSPEEPPAAHHIFLCDHLQQMSRGDILRLMISMPPGHAKSTYSSHKFPAWWMGKNPRRRFIQAGHTQNFCENQLGKVVRGIVKDERYGKVFPDIRISSESNAAGFWALQTGGSYLTKGVGQGIAGFRAHCAGVDDPFASREDAESETIREKTFNWFSADFTTRLLPRCPMYIVATRWHPDDLCARVEAMNKEGKGYPWTIINLPALAKAGDAMGRAPGEALWPELFDVEYLLHLKATLPPRDWNSLYQGEPTNGEGGMVSSDKIARYTDRPVNLIDEYGRVTKWVVKKLTISCDTASKDKQRHDPTAITVWVETVDRRHYLIDVVVKRVQFDDLVTLIEDTTRRWQLEYPGTPTAILVEDKGSGTQYIQTRAALAPAVVIPIPVTNTSKEFRFDGVSPMFTIGEVVLPTRAVWLPDYEKEIFEFDGKGTATHDDQVDSTSQYLAWSRQGRGRGSKKLRGTGYKRR